MSQKSTEDNQPGMGCRKVILVIVGCFGLAGVIFFVGRAIDGDRGSYYLFYSFLVLSIVATGVYQYFSVTKKNKK